MSIHRLLTVGFALLTAHANAATVFSGTYSWGSDGNVPSFPYNGTGIALLTVSDATKNGINSTSNAGNFRASSWATGATDGGDDFSGSIDLNKYIEFTLTAAEGHHINMTSITFGLGRSGTGPRQWEWRSSADDFSGAINTYSTVNLNLTNSSGILTTPDSDSSWTGNILDLSSGSHSNLSSITFRLYGYNAEGTQGTGGLQGDLSFSGTLIPEPSSALLLMLGTAGLLRRKR